MTTVYPTSKDSFDRPTASSSLSGHAALHDDLADAIEAIENKVGVTGDTTAGTVEKRLADLEGTDFTITFGAGSDLDGSVTVTNLGNVTNTTVAVRDDSHNHVISNVDGLQDALDGKQAAGSYLPSNADGTTTGTLTVGGTGKYLRIKDTVNNTHTMTFATADMSANRTVTFPNATGTVALTSDFSGASVNYATSAGSAATAGYASTAGNADTVDSLHASAFARSSGRQTITNCGLTGSSYSGASLVLDASAGSEASISFYHYWNGLSYAPQIRSAGPYLYFRDGQDGDNAILSVNKIESRNPSLNSSRTIKHDIEAFTGDATSIVDGLETVTFRYNDGDTEQQHLGFIAEDVATVFPMAVDQSGDTPTLNIAHIIALSVAGLQEANTRITELEAKVAELEGR